MTVKSLLYFIFQRSDHMKAKLTNETIASHFGIATSTVARFISKLKRSGLITRKGSEFTLNLSKKNLRDIRIHLLLTCLSDREIYSALVGKYRQIKGIKRAKRNGKRIGGRRTTIPNFMLKRITKKYQQNKVDHKMSNKKLAKKYKISQSTLYRIVKHVENKKS